MNLLTFILLMHTTSCNLLRLTPVNRMPTFLVYDGLHGFVMLAASIIAESVKVRLSDTLTAVGAY